MKGAIRHRWRYATGVAVLATGCMALMLNATASAAKTPAKTAAASSGTITFGELPDSGANYIFPFANLSFFSVPNTQYFQNLMYRPLYWFGTGAEPTLNLKYSVGKQPQYSNH